MGVGCTVDDLEPVRFQIERPRSRSVQEGHCGGQGDVLPLVLAGKFEQPSDHLRTVLGGQRSDFPYDGG